MGDAVLGDSVGLFPQPNNHQLGSIEKPNREPAVAQSTAHDHPRPSPDMHPKSVAGKPSLVRSVQRSDERKPDLTAVGMTRKHEIKPQARILGEVLWPVREQHRISISQAISKRCKSCFPPIDRPSCSPLLAKSSRILYPSDFDRLCAPAYDRAFAFENLDPVAAELVQQAGKVV